MTIKNAIEFLTSSFIVIFALTVVLSLAYVGSSIVLHNDPLAPFKPDVYILSFTGDIDETKLFIQGDIKYSYRYPYTKTGLIILNPDGTVDDILNTCWGNTLGELKHNMQTSCKRTIR